MGRKVQLVHGCWIRRRSLSAVHFIGSDSLRQDWHRTAGTGGSNNQHLCAKRQPESDGSDDLRMDDPPLTEVLFFVFLLNFFLRR